MNKELREQVIGRLEIMRGHGQFDEFEEETMDFNKCSDEELQYYNDNWITGQFDDEKITTTTIEGYFTEDQANKIRERMQGKTYLNFNVDYSNQNGNCKLIVSTDYYEENDYNTKEEFEQVLHDDFIYFALQEMI